MFLVLSVSIGYSALSSSLNITGIVGKVRVKSDIRITNISLENISNEGQSNYNEYNKENISIGVKLPNNNSSVTYKVEVTNIGNVEMGILSIEGLPETLEYKLTNYELKEKICDENNVCKLGIKKEFNITIKYKGNINNTNITEYNLNLKFNFRQAYNITYEGITNNNYPISVLEGEILKVEFTSPIPKVVPYINGKKIEYTYENNIIEVPNITGDITLKYKDKVYLTQLSSGTYFKESAYKTKIKTVSFVDYIDIPSDALATYNLEENNGTEIKGWIDTNYNLYIGSEWDIYSKDLSYAFYQMSGVTNIAFNNLNTSEATTMRNMFSNMSSLTSLDVSSFDTSNVTNMRYMFESMTNLKSLNLSNFNTVKVTNMGAMFYNMSSLTSLDLSSFSTSKVTSMWAMFNNCSKLTSLDLSHFNTANVTEMNQMFQDCSSLTSLNVSSFNTSKVTNMSSMFQGLKLLTTLDITNFNTSKVTNMSYMFLNMENITNLDLSNFNTSKVTNMTMMFQTVGKLKRLDLSSFNTSEVTEMRSMFTNMWVLDTLNLSQADFTKVTSYSEMFSNTSGSTTTPITITVKDTAAQTFVQNRLNDVNISGNIIIN